MKLIAPLVMFFIACGFASKVTEENSKPQPLVDLHNLRTNLKTKNEAVGRFIKLLYGSTATTEKPTSDEPDSKLSLLSRSFRRLNIFGLQSPPDEPKKNLDGTLSEDPVPVTLYVINKAEYVKGPSFSIVVPDDDIDRSVDTFEPVKNHYPKLNLKELVQQQETRDFNQPPTRDLFQPNYNQGFPSGYQQQPFAYQV